MTTTPHIKLQISLVVNYTINLPINQQIKGINDNSQIEDIAPTISEQPDTNQRSQQVIDLPLIMGDLVADFVYNQEPISDPLTVKNHDISTQLPITQIDHDPAREIFTDLQIEILSEHAMLQPHNMESQSRNMESS
ncbi:hypothetical protein Q3G72_034210 [Acer saccharum]|nr:hypothetical protein Q3G72_034210 [Acer saccharum]